MLNTCRDKIEKPIWIGEFIWAELIREWSNPEYLQKREVAQQNRSSDFGSLGASLHIGGSIPLTEHVQRMREELGREPTLAEIHARMHRHKTDQSCVNERSRNVDANFERLRAEAQSSQASGSAS